jgi:hypothetical protein
MVGFSLRNQLRGLTGYENPSSWVLRLNNPRWYDFCYISAEGEKNRSVLKHLGGSAHPILFPVCVKKCFLATGLPVRTLVADTLFPSPNR